jgi:hypothetical protein
MEQYTPSLILEESSLTMSTLPSLSNDNVISSTVLTKPPELNEITEFSTDDPIPYYHTDCYKSSSIIYRKVILTYRQNYKLISKFIKTDVYMVPRKYDDDLLNIRYFLLTNSVNFTHVVWYGKDISVPSLVYYFDELPREQTIHISESLDYSFFVADVKLLIIMLDYYSIIGDFEKVYQEYPEYFLFHKSSSENIIKNIATEPPFIK